MNDLKAQAENLQYSNTKVSSCKCNKKGKGNFPLPFSVLSSAEAVYLPLSATFVAGASFFCRSTNSITAMGAASPGLERVGVMRV